MTPADLTHEWTVVATQVRHEHSDRWDYGEWSARVLLAAREAGEIITAQRRNPDGSLSLVAMRSARPRSAIPRDMPTKRPTEPPTPHPPNLGPHIMRRVREGATHARIAAEMGMTADQVSGVVRRVKGRG